MHLTRTILPVALALATLAVAQAADVRLRPGLWEMQSTVKTSSGQVEAAMAKMQEQLASMPPAQRKQMEQMMAQRGMSLPGAAEGGGTATALKVCMTQKDVDMDNIPTQEGCTHKVTRAGPGQLTMSFQCEGKAGQPPSSGEGTMTIESPTAFSGRHRMHTQVQGKPEQMDMTQKGRWLSADCGQVKPLRQER
ncbi:DUF3617 domain-containing protein [Comamonas badia]|uniref:DUF3617 domain-containing protein n=1 Tax=Comamonas badia TaxID=265291 RepID=UPI0003FA1CD6|nr:DUF3617 domain-containing protein [Comamonas badia]